MSDKITLSLCILWEDELRAASRLFHQLNEVPDDKAHEDERLALIGDAFRASQAALWGLTDDRAAVLIANAAIRAKTRLVPRAKRK